MWMKDLKEKGDIERGKREICLFEGAFIEK